MLITHSTQLQQEDNIHGAAYIKYTDINLGRLDLYRSRTTFI
jgi:hypothetical protein